MSSIVDVMERFIAASPGVRGVILATGEGLKYASIGEVADASGMSAASSAVLSTAREASEAAGVGEPTDVAIFCERGTLYFRAIRGGFILYILGDMVVGEVFRAEARLLARRLERALGRA